MGNFGGVRPAYLVEFSKMDQVTWFCTKLGQVTWICNIVDQITCAGGRVFAFCAGPAEITRGYLEIEGQVDKCWIYKAVDQVAWETKRKDQITSTTRRAGVAPDCSLRPRLGPTSPS